MAVDQVVDDAVTRWQAAGVLDEDTVSAIRAFEAGVSAPAGPDAESAVLPTGRAGLVAEGLAYVGAALAFGAAFALLGELWRDLGGVARTVIAGAGTLALGGAAAALAGQASDAVRRLRTLLAALAAAGVGLTVGIGLDELTGVNEELTVVLAGAAALGVAIAVHRSRPSWPSTLVMGVALLTTLIGGEGLLGLDASEVAPGITVAAVGLAWAALGWAGTLRPRSAFEITGLLAGGFGIQMLAFDAFEVAALVVGLVVAGGAVAVGMIEDRTSPAVLGGLGFTVFAPQLVFQLFGDTIGGPLALFVGGLALVTVAVLVLRQRGRA